jgi:hypothetical protein
MMAQVTTSNFNEHIGQNGQAFNGMNYKAGKTKTDQAFQG